ncbi:type I restriction endonuclease subunit R [Variovorax sp. GT1P44]|uniref:type I restriction endonuclease subunit R n=1 Tax=Variovorax sp. GT1P44 TaxID=3443742 RepID=UPI003F47293E
MSDAAASPALEAVFRVLRKLGWHALSKSDCLGLRGGTREVILRPRLVEYLRTRRFDYKGTPCALSSNAIEQILRELTTLGLSDGLLAANERLYARLTYGITVTEFMADGKKHQPTIALIDWSDPTANRFEVTEEPRVLSSHGTHERAPDIVGYVNGLPLVVIEAISQEAPGRRRGEALVHEGIARHLRNQRDDEVPLLYAYAQLLLSLGETDARYGTTRTPAGFWAQWNREEELALGAKSSPSNAQDRLLMSLLTPSRLLELIRSFILFDRRAGKIIARHQQFFGVRALLRRLVPLRPDGSREGGVVWHTTGSGKSFTMVFLTRALLLCAALKECRVVVVTDRVDLERQLARNFATGGAFGASVATQKEGERSRAMTGRDLARRIGVGTERITFALVQKFNTASRLPECRNESPNIIVLVDEAHRSHGGEMHQRMKKALPRAARVAFTGTPLLKHEKTTNKFGPVVHAYTMQDAVQDRAVAPLLYEERVPGLTIDAQAVDRWFDRIAAGLGDAQRAGLKKKFARRGTVYSALQRYELVAWDIATHFSENIGKVAPGLKGQLATASKRDAIRYKKALDDTGLVTSVVVISPPDVREGDDNEDEAAPDEVRSWWRQNVLASGSDALQYERQALRTFATDDGPDLLIVVDRLLTGFDEPRNAVLYIDKPLQGHNLIQAVARVNRLHAAKRHGLLVDYRGVLAHLDTAMRAYQDLQTRTQGGFDAVDLAGLYAQIDTEYERLPSLHRAMWTFFEDVADRDDPGQLRQALSPRLVPAGRGIEYDERQQLRDDFSVALTAFGLCLRTALSSRSFFEDPGFSEALLERYKQDLRLLGEVRRTARSDAMEAVDFSAHEEQLWTLVDQHVTGMEVREAGGSYVVHPLAHAGTDDAWTDDAWTDDKARNEAALMTTRLRRTIALDLADDPYAQKVFSGQLKSAIAAAEAMFEHPRKQYALLREFERRVDARETPGMPDVLANNPQARAYFGAILMALGDEAVAALDAAQRSSFVDHALVISQVVQRAMAEHSLNPQGLESAIRKGLLTRLYAPLGLDKASEVIGHVLRITRVGPSRRP